MGEASSIIMDFLSEAALRRIDDLCTSFEDAWKVGEEPRLETFLTGVKEPERTELLRELLRLELHYRQVRGERLAADDYESRFPGDAATIREIFGEKITAEVARPVETELDATGPPAGSSSADGEARPRWPRVPGYEILGELGRGGMGVVYQARQTALKRLVALKMIRSGEFAGPRELARFRAEAEALARLRHPNIVQIYEVGQERDCPFFSLEFMEGGSLDHRVHGTPQPARLAADFTAVLARAMHAAHQSGVVHRDLKPANVLLRLRPDVSEGADQGEQPLEAFEPKITDFGLAKRLDDDVGQTHTGAIMGTPSYMAPEQAEGRTREVGPAADIYALTAILYELLTGRPPFKGASPRDTIAQVCTQEPVPVRHLQPSVPRDLETICLKGLRKDPRQRYASAADLADDLQRWLERRPILARPVPGWERAWKGARRRPELAGLALAVFAALVGLATVGFIYGRHKAQQLTRGQTINHLWTLGQAAEAAGQLETAREHWEKAQSTLEADPAAADEEMPRLLREGLERVHGRLKEQTDQQGLLARRQKFAEQRQRFERQRDRVLFHAVPFREQDAADDAAMIRQAAPAALAELGLNLAEPQALAAGLAPFRPLFEVPAQLNRVAEECVEVLLAWADAELTTPGPDHGPRQALRLLNATAALAGAHELGATRAFHLRRAKCLEQLGDAAARAEQQHADRIPPATALDFFETALADYRADRVTEASAACAKAILLQPDHFWAHYVKALCDLRQERWGEAEVELGICLGQGPAYPWLLSLRGLAHVGLKAFDRAEADFAQALADSSDPAFRAAALTNRSRVRILQGRRDDAEHDLREAIALEPSAYQGYVALAQILDARGDHAGAITQLDRALERRPGNAALSSERARLHARMGERTAARRDFEQVIASEPPGSKSDHVVAARVELAHLLSLAGEHAAALAECDAALAARNDFAEAYRQRAEVLLALKKNDEAGAALDLYLKLGGKPTAAIYEARGLLHAGHREYRAAVAAYSQALVLKEEAKTLTERGWAYLMQEAAQPALDDFDAALRLQPADTDALIGRGRALVLRARLVDVPAATAAVEQALRPGLRTVKLSQLMACVRIDARAARILTAARDPLAAKCIQRSLELLDEVMQRTPEPERSATWRRVLADPDLQPLQDTASLLQLQRKYGR